MAGVSSTLPWEVSDRRVGSPPQEVWSCPALKTLAEQFRHCRAAPSPGDDDTMTSSGGVPVPDGSRSDVNGLTKKRAAVLLCLYVGADEEFRVILTKRSGNLSSHSGEVALPGGKRDESDVDDIATALREAHEEIGLLPSQVRVISSLEPFLSKNLLTVIPVVCLLDDVKQFSPVPNPKEVEAIFDAPLEMFLKNENYWFQDREWLGVRYRVHYFNYSTEGGDKFLVWGLTASMLIRAASMVYGRKPEFVEFAPDFEKMITTVRGLACNPVPKPSTPDDKADIDSLLPC